MIKTHVHYVPESWGSDTGMWAEVLEASLTVELHVSWERCMLFTVKAKLCLEKFSMDWWTYK